MAEAWVGCLAQRDGAWCPWGGAGSGRRAAAGAWERRGVMRINLAGIDEKDA
ncbi:hypothetical protein GCM10022416_42610 [Actinomadura keratinilytica]|uniref:Uncharacterized protein n=1 Tax=Actinomadura keratinilytica TaxID=547461 RepID=A0ABP7Z6L1_9ACTN